MLDEAAQRRLLDSVVRIAARLAATEPEPEEAVPQTRLQELLPWSWKADRQQACLNSLWKWSNPESLATR